jgi:chemotaxis protein CheZ
VAITASAERELAQLLRDNAPPEVRKRSSRKVVPDEWPIRADTCLSQDSVDDLSDLGF